jgi:hypothetical protein
MLYGVGDGTNYSPHYENTVDLDEELNRDFADLLAEGTNGNVKFTAQVNYSQNRQAVEGFRGTQRLHLPSGAAAWSYEWPDGSALKKLYLPETLRDFIRWSKQTYPADKYILILSDHGGGWKPTEDYPKTAALPSLAGGPNYGILFDENFDSEPLSSFDLAKGIKDSGTQFEMVFYAACYMNMLENLGELAGSVHYTYGANHVTTSTIFDLAEFVRQLKKGGDIVQRMDEFAGYSIEEWNKTQTDNIDIAFVDLTRLEGVFTAVKKAADFLAAVPDQGVLAAITEWPIKKTKTASNVDGVYFYDSFSNNTPTEEEAKQFMFVDLYQFLQYLQATVTFADNPAFDGIVTGVEAACRAAILHGRESAGMPISPTTFGVNLINHDRFNGEAGSVWADNVYEGWITQPGYIGYMDLQFTQNTGWYNVFNKLIAVPKPMAP